MSPLCLADNKSLCEAHIPEVYSFSSTKWVLFTSTSFSKHLKVSTKWSYYWLIVSSQKCGFFLFTSKGVVYIYICFKLLFHLVLLIFIVILWDRQGKCYHSYFIYENIKSQRNDVILNRTESSGSFTIVSLLNSFT